MSNFDYGQFLPKKNPVYLKLKAAHTISATAAGSVISSQLRRMKRMIGTALLTAASLARSPAGRGVSEFAKRLRKVDGIPFNAFTISSRPRRSAIRMVAELKLLVDSSSSLRSLAGISPTER